MAWRCLMTQVAMHQSEFGMIKNLLARSYFSFNKFEGHSTGNRLLCSKGRFQSSYEASDVAHLKELHHQNNPEAVIRAFESQHSLHDNPSALTQYIKALVKVDRLEGSEVLKTLLKGTSKSAKEEESIGGLSYLCRNVAKCKKDGILATIRDCIPFHTVGDGSNNFKDLLMKTSMSIVVIFVLISGAGALIDDKLNIGFGRNEKVQPILGSTTRFKDVKGADEAKAELEEIVHHLRDPKRFTRLGGKLPKGVLLVGPPGTGKTMLAEAFAGEAGVPCFTRRGSDFDDMNDGVGARRIRDLFSAAKKKSPCIIFIDEIDAVGGSRYLNRFTPFSNKTLNQLLVELDGFDQNEGIIVIAATNASQLLDPALVRAGRFDQRIPVSKPGVEGRRQILESYMSKIIKGDDVDVTIIARGTPGFSGADLANLVNVAALRAAKKDAKAVMMDDFESAKDKILMGNERKTVSISEKNRRITAFHEAGHALVAIHTAGALPIHKATIVPRGSALGRITQLPVIDQTSISRKQMLAQLDVSMGGKVAEGLIFGESEVTSGASTDLSYATRLARAMVTRFGMSNQVGHVAHNYIDDGRSMSPETRLLIEKEVKNLLDTAYNNAKTILTTHSNELHALANALLEQETLTGTQIKTLLEKVRSQQKQQKQQALESQDSKKSNTATAKPQGATASATLEGS